MQVAPLHRDEVIVWCVYFEIANIYFNMLFGNASAVIFTLVKLASFVYRQFVMFYGKVKRRRQKQLKVIVMKMDLMRTMLAVLKSKNCKAGVKGRINKVKIVHRYVCISLFNVLNF